MARVVMDTELNGSMLMVHCVWILLAGVVMICCYKPSIYPHQSYVIFDHVQTSWAREASPKGSALRWLLPTSGFKLERNVLASTAQASGTHRHHIRSLLSDENFYADSFL